MPLTDNELQEAINICVAKRRKLEAAGDVYTDEYLRIREEHIALDEEQLRRAKRAQEAYCYSLREAFK